MIIFTFFSEIAILKENLGYQVTQLGKVQEELLKWKALHPFTATFWNLISSKGQSAREIELEKQVASLTQKISILILLLIRKKELY